MAGDVCRCPIKRERQARDGQGLKPQRDQYATNKRSAKAKKGPDKSHHKYRHS
jgi:hypothetical protein